MASRFSKISCDNSVIPDYFEAISLGRIPSQSGPGLEFDFGLKPVIKFVAGCAAASFEDFLGTSPDLLRCGRWRFRLRCGLFRLLVRLRFRVFVSLFHLFHLLVWFVVYRLENFKNSFAVSFGPNDENGEEKRRETDDYKAPDGEHLPIQMIGFV